MAGLANGFRSVAKVQQSGHDDRPERGNEMSASGERNLVPERRQRVEFTQVGNILAGVPVGIAAQKCDNAEYARHDVLLRANSQPLTSLDAAHRTGHLLKAVIDGEEGPGLERSGRSLLLRCMAPSGA